MDALLQTLTIIAIVGHTLILAYGGIRYRLRGANLLWLMAFVGLAVLVSGAYLLPAQIGDDAPHRGTLLIGLCIGIIALNGLLILRDITAPTARRSRLIVWGVLAGLWLAVLVLTTAIGSAAIAGEPEWFITAFTAIDGSAIVAVAGYIIAYLGLFVYSFWRFYRARLPEIANRTLYWIAHSAITFFSVLLIASGTTITALFGLPLLLVSSFGVAYALHHHHVFDVRQGIFYSVRVGVAVTLAAILVGIGVWLALDAQPQTDAERLVVASLTAVTVALIYVALRQLIDNAVLWFVGRRSVQAAVITREYSQLIAEVIELDALIPSATSTLNRVLGVRGSCIILLNQTSESAVNFIVMAPNSSINKKQGQIAVNGKLYARLAKQRESLLQFDIEFEPHYQDIPAAERDFFRSLGMSAYAPITLDYTMIGILAVGPKMNDTAYYAGDMELLTTLAQQTGIALRNARLLEDSQHLNKSMQSLNRKLKSTNEQLSQMDSVKSDFVTIASHELRTPLAQIRGYTDIMDALNEQGILDPDQINNLIANLRKATERMEELISAMLDVSQLDVDAMDLRFAQTSIESLIRMAIEPLTDAIRQRKLTLSARGLRGLPNVQADLQRLVQAFRNVIVNAIKFTPDGGKIDISASLQEAQDENGVDHILVRIQDSGVGIDKANLEMIFKKFFRAYDPSLHSTGSYKFLGAGPGLGLTITRGVIEGHGGRIWAESPGHDMEALPGATFNIMIPVNMPQGARRVLSFEGTAANDAIGRTPDMQRNTAMRKPNTAPLSENG
ncbi:MAG: hypothetical protein EA396_13365 [Anaerolineaceae bacterium]|nr:MAG: hypothetical protein EA396_13365 [Anaerolineaceae bacterium]